jgi:hypothetical protein
MLFLCWGLDGQFSHFFAHVQSSSSSFKKWMYDIITTSLVTVDSKVARYLSPKLIAEWYIAQHSNTHPIDPVIHIIQLDHPLKSTLTSGLSPSASSTP